MKHILIPIIGLFFLLPPIGADKAGAQEKASMATGNDFPTRARAEFVFACMAANETNQEFITRCSCAIDVIARHMRYDEYEKAETIVRLQLGVSEREQAYKSVGLAKKPLEKLFRAQAASELTCF